MFQDVYSEGLMHVCLDRGVEGRFGRFLICAEWFKAFLCCCSGIRTGSLG